MTFFFNSIGSGPKATDCENFSHAGERNDLAESAVLSNAVDEVCSGDAILHLLLGNTWCARTHTHTHTPIHPTIDHRFSIGDTILQGLYPIN